MLKQTALVVCLCITRAAFADAFTAKGVTYQGGTITTLKQGDDYKVMMADTALHFGKDGRTSVAYADIQSIEYGQKAGRRVGAAIGWTVVAGPIGLLALASKKRKHFITLTWGPAENTQAAVLEFQKDDIRQALVILETKTHKQIEYEDENAKKDVNK